MQHYSDDFRMQVIAAWQAGGSLRGVAQQFGIPATTVQNFVQGRTRAPVVRKNVNERIDDETIDDIAWAHVKAGALASEAILRKATDDRWLEQQNAANLAVLYGVISDKQLRLLAAFHSPADPQGDPVDVHGTAAVG